MTKSLCLAIATGFTLAALAQAASPIKEAAKLRIKPLEGKLPGIEAQYNPKEITVDKRLDWEKSKDSRDDAPSLEFKAAEPKTMSFELMFDTFETKENVYDKFIAALEAMAKSDEGLKRPPRVSIIWGNALPRFEGVISSLSVKYTLFLPNGTPVRATVNVGLQMAEKVALHTPHCNNDIMDEDETGPDCGGVLCLPCNVP
ncbi:MAG: hypothetical protein JWO30_3619 [Fibrobacteres bacterium]|nr:hypothetical protein [Fibrobacterota bacterium]